MYILTTCRTVTYNWLEKSSSVDHSSLLIVGPYRYSVVFKSVESLHKIEIAAGCFFVKQTNVKLNGFGRLGLHILYVFFSVWLVDLKTYRKKHRPFVACKIRIKLSRFASLKTVCGFDGDVFLVWRRFIVARDRYLFFIGYCFLL